uniref:Ras-GAP domain-containing protein n=1 Tax=Panagrolaimus sp. JU765 TaxID=591449 RepID=A0AC34Q5E6_9BILA
MRIFNLLVETFNHAFSSTQFNQTAPPEVPGTLLLPSTTNSGNENSGFSSPDVIANIEDTALNAVAHVVGSNLELGISRLIDTAWTGEPKLRRWILEAICRVLSQKSSGNANTLSEVNAQQCELLKLITIISDEGSLPLVNALINALPNDNVDQLSRVLVIAFSERHLLSELLWTVLIREAECVMSPSTLFRGSSLAAKIISYCFRVFGVSYLYETLSPLFQMMQKTPDRSYEIEQDRLPSGTTAEAGIEATLQVAELAFNLILQSESKFPFQLKSVCHAIYHVINSRFPGCGLSALGKILFLRFFNPVIVSPYESQMIGRRPTKAMSRGLTLISKILQTTVNQPTHPKESSMIHFQQLMLSKIDAVNNFLSTVALNETAETWMDNEITTQPSVNLPLLQNIHELFSKNRCEIVQHLRLLATHTNLCSRIDALLHALPDQLPSRQLLALNDSCDPSLPAFYQINSEHHSNSAPIFILVLRRVLSSDLDTIKKQIEERHSKGKFICVVDCLCCEYPANLAKLFPANVLQSIERFIVLFCSPKIFTQLNDAHFSKLPIFFDLSSIAVHYDSLPPLTLRQMSTQAFSVYRAKILSANETDVVVKLIDNTVKLDREARWRGRPITVSEIFPCAAFEQIELINDKTVTFLINENHIISLRLEKAREFVDKIFIMRSKNSVAVCADAHIHLQANYKDVITLSLVNMMDQDVLVRCVAYRLLNTLTTTLNLDISSHVQEAPCVCVPTNPATFLMPIIDILVENQPTLLLNMLPKIVHHPNASSLIGATINAWKILGKLENEQLNELFTLLISATSMHTPFSSLILSNVWPIIGEQTTILDSLLTYMLRSSHSLQLLTEISQSLVTKSCAFSNIVINRIMGELSSTTDNNLPKLLALLLVMSFDLSQIDIENQLANIMHVTTCLAGNSSRFIRCTIFAITSNIFHGFGANTKYKFTEEFHRCLSIFLRQLNSEETLRLFNVLDYGSGPNVVDAVMKMINEHDDNEIYAKSASEDSSSDHQPSDVSHEEDNKQQVSLSNIHQLVSLMMAMVADIEKAMENKREWLVEWRSMTRHWVFQPTFPPNLQIRALIAYSCLATSVSDADIKAIVSMLLQVVKRRESLTSISGVTLSLIRLHTLTTSNCAVHRFVFWIAILLFQLEHATIYEYAIQLLHANLVNLDQMGVFEHTSIEKMAMESRVHLEWDLKALDQYAGLSFKANFNFALVGYLLKGLRQPFLSTKVSQLLQLLLRITAKCSHSNPFILTKETLPYLLALLPFDEKVQQRFRLSSNPDQQNTRCVLQPQWTIQGLQPPDVFTENPVINVWNEDEEEETTILLDPNIINEEQLQSLTVTVLAILARSCPNVHIVLDYLLEAVSVFPSVVPVIECLLDQKIVGLVQSCHSVQMLSTVVKLIETSALEDSPAGITPQQVCSFLQQSGFAGLWRYAGAFLSPRASRQAINANLVSCLECIVACLGST